MNKYKKFMATIIFTVFSLSPVHFVLAAPVAPIAPGSPESAAVAPVAPKPAAGPEEEQQPVPGVLEEAPQERTANFNGVEALTPLCQDCGAEAEQSLPVETPESQLQAQTGDSSSSSTENKEGEGSENETTIDNENNASVENKVSGTSNSGGNNASYNTGHGSVETGDTNLAATFLNFINSNVSALGGGLTYILKNILGNLVGDYLLQPGKGSQKIPVDTNINNSETGAASVNDATLETVNSLIVENQNKGQVNNDIELVSNTGGNEASYNTGDGSIKTGDSNISLSILNFLNTNFIVTETGIIAIINVFGDWFGDLLLPANYTLQNGETVATSVNINNFNTGANSTNNASLDSSQGAAVENNNQAEVNNNIEVAANTGNNLANYNTGGGDINSGASIAGVAIKNDGNSNIFADILMYLTVNVLGGWVGEILLPSSNQISDADNNSLETSNKNTGAGSENNTNLVSDESINVRNDNNTLIGNNIKLLSNTGQNSASYNTGSGQVTTGDAKALLNILNIFNQNIFGGRVLYLMVNVFGNWVGNIDIDGTPSEDNVGNNVKSGGESPRTIINIFEDKAKNVRVNKVGDGFRAEIVNDNEVVEQKVLSANVSSAGSSGDGSVSAIEKPSFWRDQMGTIFGILFLLYLIALIIAGYRKKQREELFKEFV